MSAHGAGWPGLHEKFFQLISDISEKLLDEHDIIIEYLENLENPMYQKYFQLASLIDPIIDGCYHIPS